jgi:uncharacterized iron-regulated membrane protein
MRKLFWRLHSVIGLLSAIGLIVIGLTGVVLVFNEEIDALVAPELHRVEPTAASRLSMNERVAAVEREFPRHAVTGWKPAVDVHAADGVFVMPFGTREWHYVTVDPYRAVVLGGPRLSESTLKGWVLELHSALFLGDIGVAIAGLLGVALCFLGLSGLWLYRRFWKSIFRLRIKSSMRLLLGDFHRMVGVLSVVFNLLLGFTGAFWNVSHTIEHLSEPHESEDEVLFSTKLFPVGFDVASLPGRAKEHLPGFETHYISFPWKPEGPFTLWGSAEDSAWFRSPYGSQVSFDSQTGAFVSLHDLRKEGLWAQVKDSFEPLHFGNFGGLPIKILWAAAGMAPGLLAVSGMAIWWKRRKPRAR